MSIVMNCSQRGWYEARSIVFHLKDDFSLVKNECNTHPCRSPGVLTDTVAPATDVPLFWPPLPPLA